MTYFHNNNFYDLYTLSYCIYYEGHSYYSLPFIHCHLQWTTEQFWLKLRLSLNCHWEWSLHLQFSCIKKQTKQSNSSQWEQHQEPWAWLGCSHSSQRQDGYCQSFKSLSLLMSEFRDINHAKACTNKQECNQSEQHAIHSKIIKGHRHTGATHFL